MYELIITLSGLGSVEPRALAATSRLDKVGGIAIDKKAARARAFTHNLYGFGEQVMYTYCSTATHNFEMAATPFHNKRSRACSTTKLTYCSTARNNFEMAAKPFQSKRSRACSKH